MEVLILKGQKTARDLNGRVWRIEGIEITRSETKMKYFYHTEDPFYLAAAAEGTKSNAYMSPKGNIVLL